MACSGVRLKQRDKYRESRQGEGYRERNMKVEKRRGIGENEVRERGSITEGR